MGKILPGKETRINTPVDGNWYAIVMYLEDACKSCPNNQESMNESNNWNVSCMNELDDELCKKYFNNCH